MDFVSETVTSCEGRTWLTCLYVKRLTSSPPAPAAFVVRYVLRPAATKLLVIIIIMLFYYSSLASEEAASVAGFTSTMAGDLYSPPSPLGDSLVGSPLCGDLMEDIGDISHSIGADTLGFDFPQYQSPGSLGEIINN